MRTVGCLLAIVVPLSVFGKDKPLSLEQVVADETARNQLYVAAVKSKGVINPAQLSVEQNKARAELKGQTVEGVAYVVMVYKSQDTRQRATRTGYTVRMAFPGTRVWVSCDTKEKNNELLEKVLKTQKGLPAGVGAGIKLKVSGTIVSVGGGNVGSVHITDSVFAVSK